MQRMTQRDRELYDKLRQQFPNAIITQSVMRQEALLANNNQSYAFNFDGNVAGKSTEKKLSQQDTFVANRIGLFLLREDASKIGSGVLRTSVTAEFAAAAGFVPGDLEAVWNGNLSASVGQTKVFDAIDSQPLRKVVDEQTDGDGTAEINPNLTFDGKEKNKVELYVPTWNGIQMQSVAAGIDHKVVVKLYGFLITGKK